MSDLANLKPGDTVAVINRYKCHFNTVEKVGKIHIWLKNHPSRFRIDNGCEAPFDGTRHSCISTSPSAFLKANQQPLRNKLKLLPFWRQGDVEAMRKKVEEAEALLRELGEWKDAP